MENRQFDPIWFDVIVDRMWWLEAGGTLQTLICRKEIQMIVHNMADYLIGQNKWGIGIYGVTFQPCFHLNSESTEFVPSEITLLKSMLYITLSGEIAHFTVYHRLSQVSVDNQSGGLTKCRHSNAAEPGDFLFTGLDATVTVRMRSRIIHCPRSSQKLQFSELPNQHGTTWAITSTAQWADCFWEYTQNPGLQLHKILNWAHLLF